MPAELAAERSRIPGDNLEAVLAHYPVLAGATLADAGSCTGWRRQ